MSEEGSPVEDREEGAPQWVVTFGDLMSLLLCFFVLMLSVSEMDRKKYRIVSGSLAKAFGVQRKKPIFDVPRGQKMVAKEFDQAIVTTKLETFVAKPILIEIEQNYKEMKELVDVEIQEDQATIRMMGEATFDTGKAEIRDRFIPLLQTIGKILKKTKGEILVVGHTDNVPLKGGRYGSNLGLSLARAATVTEFLIYRSDIKPARISTMGFGEYRPMASNGTAEGRQQNRRVEIVISH